MLMEMYQAIIVENMYNYREKMSYLSLSLRRSLGGGEVVLVEACERG